MKKEDILLVFKDEEIKKMLKENRNLNLILDYIKAKKTIQISYPTLKKKMKEVLGLEWDKEKKKWTLNGKLLDPDQDLILKSKVDIQLDILDQLTNIGETREPETIDDKGKTKEKDITNPQILSPSVDSNKTIENHLETIIKQMNQLNEQIKANKKQKKGDIDLLSMPYGNSIKKTISINTTLLEKIKTLMYDSFGIKGNDCEIIRLALCYLVNSQQK